MTETVVAALLVASGALVVAAALGLARLPDFFQRLHASALANTLATWAVVLASVLDFSALEARASLHVWLIAVLLAITAPVTTLLLARAALFRRRHADDSTAPLPLRAQPSGDASNS